MASCRYVRHNVRRLQPLGASPGPCSCAYSCGVRASCGVLAVKRIWVVVSCLDMSQGRTMMLMKAVIPPVRACCLNLRSLSVEASVVEF